MNDDHVLSTVLESEFSSKSFCSVESRAVVTS